MLSWQVGRVKITRVVEMDLPVPAKLIPQATAAELRKSAWLYPHFVSEDDTTLKLSVHAPAGRSAGAKAGRRHLRRERPAARDHRRSAVGDAVSAASCRGGLVARRSRRRGVHASARRPRRLEHDARKR